MVYVKIFSTSLKFPSPNWLKIRRISDREQVGVINSSSFQFYFCEILTCIYSVYSTNNVFEVEGTVAFGKSWCFE